MYRIFIGFDQKETVAYHALCNSILRQSSAPVSFTPVNKDNIPEFDREKTGSTDFSFSRFLVPYLCDYKGLALFLDCDMIVNCDIAEVFALADPSKAVQVVKHDYKTKSSKKFLGNKNEDYPCKNWSSLMLFNNKKCDSLRPYEVNNLSGAYLHRFEWCGLDKVGALPAEYNHLVGEYKQNNKAKILHYTLGTPCFDDYKNCDSSELWHKEKELLNYADQPRVQERTRVAAQKPELRSG